MADGISVILVTFFSVFLGSLSYDIPPPTGVTAEAHQEEPYRLVFLWSPVNCTMSAYCNKVIGYRYTFVSDDGTDVRNGTVQGGNIVTFYNITYCTEYNFQVATVTDNGNGTLSGQQPAKLVRLTEPKNLRAPHADLHNITMEWEPPYLPGICADLNISGYKIEYGRADLVQRSEVLVPDIYRYELRNLTGHGTYTIRIKTLGEDGKDSEWSQPITRVTGTEEDDQLSLPVVVIVGAGIGSLLLFIIVAGVIWCRKYRHSPWSPDEQPRPHSSILHESVFSNPEFEGETPRFVQIRDPYPPQDSVPDDSGSYQLPSGGYLYFMDGSMNPRDWEIAWDNFCIQETILGRGEFGIVREGKIRIGNQWITVAVKNLPDQAGETEVKNFQNELNIMKKIGRHINIVSLVGSCTHNGVLYVALEHLNRGNLLQYLRDSRVYGNSVSTCDLTYSHLISLAMDVAKGMQFLSEHKVIHRDLAARNVLVGTGYDGELIAKVCDFGLSKADGVYRQASHVNIPVKWTAIEALTRQVYTTKSDVWSFGILLWEIVTLGGTPYSTPNPIENRYLPIYLQNNHRMNKPENCDNDMYQLMLRCWEGNPASRSTFAEIVQKLERMLDDDVYVITSINNFANIDSDNE